MLIFMDMMWPSLVFFFITCTAQEILKNGDFEEPLSNSNWICNGFTCSTVDGGHSGRKQFLASNRLGPWAGPAQELAWGKDIFPGKAYFFSGLVKLAPRDNATPQTFTLTLYYEGRGGQKAWKGMIYTARMLPSDGWKQLSSNFVVEDIDQPVTKLVLYVEGPDPKYDYYCDSFSLTPIATSTSWRQTAKQRIDMLRKNDIEVSITSPQSLPNVTVFIDQVKHEFGFGTAVASYYLQNNKKYTDWYNKNFEWAVLENDFKWTEIEREKGKMTYENADKAMAILQANNKTVRGHTIVWADKQFNAPWVQQITDPKVMYDTCMKRVDDLLGRYKGRLAHWDVINEMLPSNFYEAVYGNRKISYDIFKRARKDDPSVKLFMNEYDTVGTGKRTVAYLDQVKEFLAAGVPVDGIGAQGHLTQVTPGEVYWKRLDTLALAGIPIWITELDYSNDDKQIRADALEEALTAFFSHPSVDGVLFWGFWDGRHSSGARASLVDGPDLTPNAAGLMWLRLFHTEWRTKESRMVAVDSQATVKVRGFYGDYRIRVVVNGTEILSQPFSTTKKDGRKVVSIRLK